MFFKRSYKKRDQYHSQIKKKIIIYYNNIIYSILMLKAKFNIVFGSD